MPVIFTKPPSGIAPTPYSVSPRRNCHSFGGKKRKKRSTRIPTAFAAAKCPASWRMIRRRSRRRRAPSSRRRPRRRDQRPGRARGPGVGREQVLEVARRGCAGTASRARSITSAIAVNGSSPARNASTATSSAALRTHGAVPPASPGLARQAQAGGRSRDPAARSSSSPTAARSRVGTVDVGALGVVQGVGDRHPHVGKPEVGELGAVVELDQRVDDRLRVDDDVDPLVGDAEQVVGLDHLEALVDQGRRVDRDPAAHLPGRVRERLLRASRRRGRCDPETGPPEAVRTSRSTRPGGSPREQLEQRRVLGVDRQDPALGRLGQRGDQLAADDEALLVGERDVDPLGQGDDRRAEARRCRRSRSGPGRARRPRSARGSPPRRPARGPLKLRRGALGRLRIGERDHARPRVSRACSASRSQLEPAESPTTLELVGAARRRRAPARRSSRWSPGSGPAWPSRRSVATTVRAPQGRDLARLLCSRRDVSPGRRSEPTSRAEHPLAAAAALGADCVQIFLSDPGLEEAAAPPRGRRRSAAARSTSTSTRRT